MNVEKNKSKKNEINYSKSQSASKGDAVYYVTQLLGQPHEIEIKSHT